MGNINEEELQKRINKHLPKTLFAQQHIDKEKDSFALTKAGAGRLVQALQQGKMQPVSSVGFPADELRKNTILLRPTDIGEALKLEKQFSKDLKKPFIGDVAQNARSQLIRLLSNVMPTPPECNFADDDYIAIDLKKLRAVALGKTEITR